MRISVMACIIGVLGALGGGWLVGRWCLGLVLIAASAGLVAYGLLRDDGRGRAEPQVGELKSVSSILRQAERAS